MSEVFKGWDWKVPAQWLKLETVEMHTGGEPLRIFVSGIPEIPGVSMLEKRGYFKKHYDHIRRGAMLEPRGHADMYGAIMTEPVNESSDFGVLFLHNEGYSSMCGHAIIALTTLAYQTGLVLANKTELIIDTPAGTIKASPRFRNGTLDSVSFRNVASFVYLKNKTVRVEGIGEVIFDVAFGGAFYALVNASELNLELNQGNAEKIIDLGRRIKLAIINTYDILHPFDDELGFLYGTIFKGKAQSSSNHSRNACVFANGELDRSATGTGVSARAALHYFNGDIGKNQIITIESIIGTTMDVCVKDELNIGKYKAIIPEVSGKAYVTGRNTLFFDPEDPLGKGFLIR
jgi:trans-L-3-hydroxyproline dehydratase